jgi:hypothetical protein
VASGYLTLMLARRVDRWVFDPCIPPLPAGDHSSRQLRAMGRSKPTGLGDRPMFIAMNRFRVAKGSEAAFEHVWLSRDSHLDKVRARRHDCWPLSE